jgi:hypothetical protein
MKTTMSAPSRVGQWLVVVLLAVAMAWLESAVVLYLRTLSQQFDPYLPDPQPLSPHLLRAEMAREAATLVMLASIGWLAAPTWRARAALALVAFGTWDIFYYVFLVPLTGWPQSLLDWDILFLLPLPWWGPVAAPMLIAGLMVAGGTLVALRDQPGQPFGPGRYSCLAAAVGGVLALYTFMQDAIRAVPDGADQLMHLRPERFNWPLFVPALALLAVPVLELAWRAAHARHADGEAVADHADTKQPNALS